MLPCCPNEDRKSLDLPKTARRKRGERPRRGEFEHFATVFSVRHRKPTCRGIKKKMWPEGKQ